METDRKNDRNRRPQDSPKPDICSTTSPSGKGLKAKPYKRLGRWELKGWSKQRSSLSPAAEALLATAANLAKLSPGTKAWALPIEFREPGLGGAQQRFLGANGGPRTNLGLGHSWAFHESFLRFKEQRLQGLLSRGISGHRV